MKKLLAACLALLCVLALAPAAGAAAFGSEITGLDEDFMEKKFTTSDAAVKGKNLRDLAYLTAVRPGTEIFIPLTTRDFEWDEYSATRNINAATVEEFEIKLNLEYKKSDSGIFKALKVGEKDGKIGIRIEFIDYFLSVEPEEFDVDVQLMVDGYSYPEGNFQLRGSLANRFAYVHKGTRQATLGPGRYLIGYDNVDGVEFDLGSGVTLTGDIGFYEKVYGTAVAKAGEKDKELMARYPQITKVLKVDTIGFDITAKATIAQEGDTVGYVYDDNLDYLGTTGQPLAKRGTYYIATQPLS